MMKELSTYLIENVNISQKRIYAIRKSRDDEGLQKAGFIFDPAIYEYFSNLSVNNIRNLIYRVVHKEYDSSVPYANVENWGSTTQRPIRFSTTMKHLSNGIKLEKGTIIGPLGLDSPSFPLPSSKDRWKRSTISSNG